MDFGLIGGLDNLVPNLNLENNTTNKDKWYYGSEFHKQGRRTINNEDDLMRDLNNNKIPKMSESPYQQMLSFSTQNSQTLTTLPPQYYYQQNTGGGGGGGGMYGLVTGGLRGPFTSSQWMELEHQALIYKYITANVPIPSSLLIPIRKAFESAGFSTRRPPHNSLGWGGFHFGFSNSDPEPGRCRRTDGKKWRCSRDSVIDQKYCERHMNRGRHRSRKPVEGTTNTTTKPIPAPAPALSSVVPGGGGNGSAVSNTTNTNSSGIPYINRSLWNKDTTMDGGYQNASVLSMTSPKIGLNEKHNNKNNAFDSSTHHLEFGLVCSDSLLNPLDRRSISLVKSQGSSLHQFMDDWPKNQSSTNLSITIPSDFMNNEKQISKNQLMSHDQELEAEATQMGLGVGTTITINNISSDQRQISNWVPMSSSSIGGPLGEVLHKTGDQCKEALNLMDSNNRYSRLASNSPTGVLQGGAFGSLSNSPRADGASHCNGLICAHALMHPSLPTR